MKILFILSPILFIIGCSGEPEPKISDEVQDFLFNNLKINEKFNELDESLIEISKKRKSEDFDDFEMQIYDLSNRLWKLRERFNEQIILSRYENKSEKKLIHPLEDDLIDTLLKYSSLQYKSLSEFEYLLSWYINVRDGKEEYSRVLEIKYVNKYSDYNTDINLLGSQMSDIIEKIPKRSLNMDFYSKMLRYGYLIK